MSKGHWSCKRQHSACLDALDRTACHYTTAHFLTKLISSLRQSKNGNLRINLSFQVWPPAAGLGTSFTTSPRLWLAPSFPSAEGYPCLSRKRAVGQGNCSQPTGCSVLLPAPKTPRIKTAILGYYWFFFGTGQGEQLLHRVFYCFWSGQVEVRIKKYLINFTF